MFKKNFYMFIFLLWYSTTILFTTNLKVIFGIPVTTINSIVDMVILVFLMIQIVLFQSYKKREIIFIIGITLSIVVATVLSGQNTLLSSWIFIVASKNIDLDRIIRAAYRILIIMIPMIALLCLLGFIDDRTMMRGDYLRFSLGFLHPNHLGMRVFQLMSCHCYINRNKLGIFDYLFIVLSIIFAVKIPNSQTAYVCLIVFLIVLLGYRYVVNQKKIMTEMYAKCLLIGAFLLNILSIILSYIDVSGNIILSKIDKWMSMRFSACHKVWQIYGVSFFGQRVYVLEEERKRVGITVPLWLDNAYMNMLLRYGVLVFLIFSIGYLYLIRKMTMQKKYVLVIILFLYSLYGTMEPALYMITHNIFLIAFADILYNKRKEEL